MQLRFLETLQRIVRLGSFSAAAEEGNMTLSSVSMQMKALEADLGVELFDRASRPPRLTPVGRSVAAQAARVLHEEAVMRALCTANAGLVGNLELGVISSAAIRLVPRLLEAASRLAPNAAFQFVTGLSSDLAASVLAGRLDAAIVTRVGGEDAALHFDTIGLEEMMLAAPADAKGRSLRTLAEDLRFLHFKPQSGIGRLIADTLAKEGIAARDALIFDSIETTMECVNLGLGFTLLPKPDVLRYARTKVKTIAMPPGTVRRELALVTRDDPSAPRWRGPLIGLIETVERSAGRKEH